MDIEKTNYSYLDSSGVEHSVVLDESQFAFAQKDKNIHDVKMKGKPVTFIRDAWIRFRKNKSSIVATVILGFMVLMALLLPAVIPYDVSTAHADETYLAPKLFKAGTGFWDGTKEYKDMIYDAETGLPKENTAIDMNSILKDTIKVYDGITDTVYSFGKGGYVRIGNFSSEKRASMTTPFVDVSSSMKLKYNINTDLEPEVYSQASYDLSLVYSDTEGEKEVVIKDDSFEYGDVEVDLSSYIDENSITSPVAVRISVDPIDEESVSVYVKNMEIKAGESELFSFSDANKILYDKKLVLDGDNVSLFGATITYCSFRYDTYNARYEEREMVIGESIINEYIEKGYMKYDFNVGTSSFEVLDKKHCPITEVVSQKVSTGLIEVKETTCKVLYYKYMGYTSMPLHLFGTNAVGKDMLKYVAEGTRNSLALGVIISLITFIFGLIYGALEGYFGGVADLIMERIVDILGYIPSIVVITLCVLHLGQGFGVFVLAMCMTGWIGTSGLTRTQFYRFKKREYVLASRSLGASDSRLIFVHILPNSLGTIVTSAVLMIPSVIFSEASVAYLGIGLKGMSSLGVILSDSQKYINTYSYLLVFPSIVLALMMICFNLFGNGLRDALNPSLKGSD